MAASTRNSVAAMSDRVVIVFARAPEEERRHKTLRARAAGRRLETLHRLLVDRALKAAAAVDAADVRLVTTGDLDRARAFALRRVPVERLAVSAQAAGRFGERLQAAVAGAFADGYRQVLLIGGDTPELTGVALADAFARLDAASGPAAVLGPAPDGGYYLLGLTAPVPAAFAADVPLCTDRAAAATRARLRAAGLRVTELPPLADVDTAADALALSGRLRGAAAVEDLLLRLALLDVLSSDARPLVIAATAPPHRSSRVTGARAPPYPSVLTRVQ